MLSDAEKRMLGASDFPALLGLSPWGGVVSLWARMVHGWEPEGAVWLEDGNDAEPYTRALYKRRTGYELLGPAKWRHPLHPWLRCSPDDVATPPAGRRVLELKRYQRLDGWGPDGSDEVPRDIWVQTQVQAGMGLDNGHAEDSGVDVAALLRGELRIYHVPHVPEVYARCLELGERFVADFVRPARFPEGALWHLLERDAEAVAALFPAPSEKAPAVMWDELTTEAQATLAAWMTANRERKHWEREEEALGRTVRGLLREVPMVAGLPDSYGMNRRIDYLPSKATPRLDVKALRAALVDEDPEVRRRVEALLERCTKHTASRPLVVR